MYAYDGKYKKCGETMIRFECDYLEGCHPAILERLQVTNYEQNPGYGMDEHCARAGELVKAVFGAQNADVHFMVGGTVTNKTVIASILRPYQGVIAAESGHIAVHETGAIEQTGHKVLALPSADGKVTAQQVEELMLSHEQNPEPEHMVYPGMLYISFPTENGTLYTKAELRALSVACKAHHIPLFIDGARMGYGLMSKGCDVKPSDFAQLADVFYIGGTKVGALFGEAIVIVNDALKKDFRFYIKQNGAMLAKGRLLGLQFETLFENNLYFEIAAQAIGMSDQIRSTLKECGYRFLFENATNEVFVIFTNEQLAELEKKYTFCDMGKIDEQHRAVRICSSWGTKQENVDVLLADIQRLAR